MAYLLDSERSEIPTNAAGMRYFDVDLFDWCDGKGPDISVTHPGTFVGDKGDFYVEGALTVPLQEVLEEYLESGYKVHGDQVETVHHVKAFAAWLRKYADRLEATCEPDPK